MSYIITDKSGQVYGSGATTLAAWDATIGGLMAQDIALVAEGCNAPSWARSTMRVADFTVSQAHVNHASV